MSEPTLEQAIEGLGVQADDVLASRVYPDRVVVVLRSGPKLTWYLGEEPAPGVALGEESPVVEAAPAEAEPKVRASDEARRVAGDLDVNLESVTASPPGEKITAKDVRLADAGRKKKPAGKG